VKFKIDRGAIVDIDNKNEIHSEFEQRKKELECQLDHLDKFVTDLRSHKISLENVNQQLEQLASKESDASKRAKYYVAIRSNIELLTKIFNSISELESIKHRYHKEIDDIMLEKIRLFNIDMRKLEGLKDGGENLVEFFEKLSNAMSNSNKFQNDIIKSSLQKNPEYKL